ncbi:MAG TPA: hypothetical protein VFW73_05605 [Lacipirellulaceae bacterium]|nr:hypothetical protein [Lacipirellulaceae bacterium]
MKHFIRSRFLIGMLLAASCILMVSAMSTAEKAHGEVTAAPQQRSFEPSTVPVLRDIAATLHQIDTRLARLETTVRKLQVSSAAKGGIGRDADTN